MYNSGLLLLLLRNLHRIDFEGKKDAVQIFNNILRRQIGTRTPTVEYICTKPEIVFALCHGYERQEIALNCGAMLRECIRYEALTKILLHSEQFYDFFKYVEVSTFDIASDAFATFKVSRYTTMQYFLAISSIIIISLKSNYHNIFAGIADQAQDASSRFFGSQFRASIFRSLSKAASFG